MPGTFMRNDIAIPAVVGEDDASCARSGHLLTARMRRRSTVFLDRRWDIAAAENVRVGNPLTKSTIKRP